MTSPDIKKGLTEGLLAGYGGESRFDTVRRGPFRFKRSRLDGDETVYHDEWLAGRTGGGQEVVTVGEENFTRLYAGGAIDETKLKRLEVNEKEIIVYLKRKILELGGRTRMETDCLPEPDEDWRYSYRVVEKVEALEMTVGRETIEYREETVFVHFFLLCPVNL